MVMPITNQGKPVNYPAQLRIKRLHRTHMEIKRITAEQQKQILSEKLNTRTILTTSFLNTSPDFEKKRIIAYELCQKDFVFWCDNFAWIQDPQQDDGASKDRPFLLWDYQAQAANHVIDAVTNGYDLPIEKCRKQGLTWLVLAVITWGWHFHKWECLVGSRKFEEVDRKGDMGTLFQKVRYMIQRLPSWMFTDQLDHYHNKVGMLLHPVHKASIAGEANSPDFGRSDRRKVIFLDEFSSWEQTDRASWQACSSTTHCRIPVSTPNRRGVSCWFYNVVKDYKRKGAPVLTLPWLLNPVFSQGLRKAEEEDLAWQKFGLEQTSPWLENEIRRASDTESVAQEILINYEASMGDKVFPDFKYDLQVDDNITYDPNLPLFVGMDFGLDMTSLIWFQPDRRNGVINIIDEYQNTGAGAGRATDIYHYIDILQAKDYKMPVIYGDPQSGENRSLTSGQSNASILRRYGFVFKSTKTSVKNRIAAGRNLLPSVRIAVTCTLTTEMFSSWQLHRVSGIPMHDEHSHLGDAFTYYAFGYRQISANKKPAHKRKYEGSLSGVVG